MPDIPRHRRGSSVTPLENELRYATGRPLGAVFVDPLRGDEEMFPVLTRIVKKLRLDLWRENPTRALLAVARRAVEQLPADEYPEDARKTWRSQIAWREVGELLCFGTGLPELEDNRRRYTYDDYYGELIRRTGLRDTRERSFRNHVTSEFRRRLAVILLRLEEEAPEPEDTGATSQEATDPVEHAPAETSDPARSRPRGLPLKVSHFVGRVDQLGTLDQHLERCRQDSSATPVAAISGTPGVGKTALAVYWAHRVAPQFPDGQIYLNLHGYDSGSPLAPSDALRAMLVSLGYAPEAIPPGVEERADLFRSAIANKRFLLILDNAHDSKHVELLLPGSPTCYVVVTSRSVLGGLTALLGAENIPVARMTEMEATALLRKLVPGRVDQEPTAAKSLVESCAMLPLAIRIVGWMAGSRPYVTLQALANELADERKRLKHLTIDGLADVAAVFSWSCKYLPDESAKLFELIGLAPIREFDTYIAASLSDIDVDVADGHLSVLRNANLIEEEALGRFHMHSLLRDYARQVGAARSEESGYSEALARLGVYLKTTTKLAIHALYTQDEEPTGDPSLATPVFLRPEDALVWLDTERSNLIGLAGWSMNSGEPSTVRDLSDVLYRYLVVGGHYNDALTLYGYARDLAHEHGEAKDEAEALHCIGVAYLWLGKNESALTNLEGALTLSREISDLHGQARTLGSIAGVYERQGRFDEALLYYKQDLAISREGNDLPAQSITLNNMGNVYWRQSKYSDALSCYEQALEISRLADDSILEANSLGSIGNLLLRQGKYEASRSHLQQALTSFERFGDRIGQCAAHCSLGAVEGRLGNYIRAQEHLDRSIELCGSSYPAGRAEALSELGVVHRKSGQYETAHAKCHEALEVARKIGQPDLLYTVLNELGYVHTCLGGYEEAIATHEEAREGARLIGNLFEMGRAEDGIARGLSGLHRVDEARTHWESALATLIDLGVPEAEEARRRLDG